MALEVVYQVCKSNITRVVAEAIVYSAEKDFSKGKGMSKDIFTIAGEYEIAEALKKVDKLSPGNVVLTSAFKLPARYLIHALPPEYDLSMENLPAIMSYCFVNCLMEAARNNARSIAIPILGTGSKGWPLDESVRIMVDTVKWILDRHPDCSIGKVIFVAFDKEAEYALNTYCRIKHIF